MLHATRSTAGFILFACLLASGAALAQAPALAPQLEPLRPMLERTWQSTFKNSTPEKPVIDVARWERALNGKAVRVLHSINDGAYGGETLIFWDEKKQTVAYHYFTTAGFVTMGSMRFENGKILSHESVSGSAGGITEVRGSSEIGSDGKLSVKTEYLKDGQWQPGREATYQEAPNAKVLFK